MNPSYLGDWVECSEERTEDSPGCRLANWLELPVRVLRLFAMRHLFDGVSMVRDLPSLDAEGS